MIHVITRFLPSECYPFWVWNPLLMPGFLLGVDEKYNTLIVLCCDLALAYFIDTIQD